nr:DNA polymerase domain-containing protein [Candidatus Sigynarchaeum springense]
MTTIEGWLLDVGTCKGGITCWVKDRASGEVHDITAPYRPALYLLPRRAGSPVAAADIARDLESLDLVAAASVVQRRVHVDDADTTPVVQARARDPQSFKKLVALLSAPGDFELYNADIPAFQEFLYETRLFPLCHATFDATRRGDGQLVLGGFELRDDKRRLLYSLPVMKAAWVDVVPQAGSTLETGRLDNPIKEVAVTPYDEHYGRRDHVGPPFKAFEMARGPGVDETSLITALVEQVRAVDPDIVLTRGGDERVFPYLCSRASALGIGRSVVLSRRRRPLASECFKSGSDGGGGDSGGEGGGAFFSYGHLIHRGSTQYYLSGRLHVDASVYGSLHFQDGNIPGLIEVARVSSVPVQRLNRITIGGALQSIQFQIAHERGILIPREKRHGAETFKPVTSLLLADRGGHIFEPCTGVFDRVISLDFTSMYPMIMSRFNVSPETVNCACCDPSENPIPGLGPGFHVCKKRRGLIPEAISLPLDKRIAYKQMARGLPERHGLKMEHVQAALKWILVVSFGYLGFKNARFGRVEAHQAVCAYSREMLLRAARVAREQGLDVIHGIVDSLWVRRPRDRDGEDLGATARLLCDEIGRATNLDIESDGVFKFIVFLPSVVNPAVGTLNHYWGVFANGKVKVRGIELRRRDAPQVVKAMQKGVIEALAPARDAREFMARMPRARAVLDSFARKVVAGDVDPAQLAITTVASRAPGEYKASSYQAVAARQLQKAGVAVGPGQNLKYVITNAGSSRPNDRVMAWDLFADKAGSARHDAAKYVELLERGFRNMFPFDALGTRARVGGKPGTARPALDAWLV